MRIGFEGGTQRRKDVKKAGDIGLTQRREDAKKTGIQGFGMGWNGGWVGLFFG